MAHRSAEPAGPRAEQRPQGLLPAAPAERPVQVRQERRPSAPLSAAVPWPSAQREPERRRVQEPGPARPELAARRPVPSPPTGRKPAHAARPARPRYGDSLRKTLSERERPKPLQAPTPSRLGGCLLAK